MMLSTPIIEEEELHSVILDFNREVKCHYF